MRAAVEIQENALRSIQELNALAGSLQKEFEKMAFSDDLNEKTVLAKKRQQQCVGYVIGLLRTVCALSETIEAQSFKLELCSFYHGVSLPEILFFMNRDQGSIDNDIRDFLKTGTVQVPEKLQPFMNWEKLDQLRHERNKSELKALAPHINMERLADDLFKAEQAEKRPVLPVTPETHGPPRFASRPVHSVEYLKKLAERSRNAA